MAFLHRFQEMDQFARPPAGHRRQFRRVGNGADQFQIVAALGAVAQLAGRQHFADAQIRQFLRELHGVGARRRPAAVDVDLALRGQPGIAVHVDRRDDRRTAELLDRGSHEGRIAEGGG